MGVASASTCASRECHVTHMNERDVTAIKESWHTCEAPSACHVIQSQSMVTRIDTHTHTTHAHVVDSLYTWMRGVAHMNQHRVISHKSTSHATHMKKWCMQYVAQQCLYKNTTVPIYRRGDSRAKIKRLQRHTYDLAPFHTCEWVPYHTHKNVTHMKECHVAHINEYCKRIHVSIKWLPRHTHKLAPCHTYQSKSHGTHMNTWCKAWVTQHQHRCVFIRDATLV